MRTMPAHTDLTQSHRTNKLGKQQGPHVAAVELGDGLLGLQLVGVGHESAAARLAVVVAQDVQLHDLPDRQEDLLQIPLCGLRAHDKLHLHAHVVTKPVLHAGTGVQRLVLCGHDTSHMADMCAGFIQSPSPAKAA